MNPELEVLKTAARRLDEAGIAYMITGSVAASFYAVPRMTRDIDIVIELKEENVEKVVSLFKSDFYVDAQAVRSAIRGRDMFNVIHNDSVVKIDFIVRKDSPSYRKLEFERRRKIDIEGTDVWIVSPEDLILSKMFWAKDSFSEIQMGDIKNLLKTAESLDIPYIEKWVKDLGLETIYERVTHG